CNMTDNDIFKVANSRLGLYRRCSMDVVNYLLSQKVLAIPNKKENRPGLVDPLAYYLRNT
ncbi:MAG: group II intron reverse transcriptase/maturase, partial [Clostridia bacterium]|nr:group II intron reverse transcriptase/maturase [Clostridia bacterium]